MVIRSRPAFQKGQFDLLGVQPNAAGLLPLFAAEIERISVFAVHQATSLKNGAYFLKNSSHSSNV
jgi:hypothetical protein